MQSVISTLITYKSHFLYAQISPYRGLSFLQEEFVIRHRGGECDATSFERNYVYHTRKPPFLTHRQTSFNFPYSKEFNLPPFGISCMGMAFFEPTSLRNSNSDAEDPGFSAPGGYAVLPVESFAGFWRTSRRFWTILGRGRSLKQAEKLGLMNCRGGGRARCWKPVAIVNDSG